MTATPHLVEPLEAALDDAEVDAPAVRYRRAEVPRELLIRPTLDGLLRQAAFDWSCLIALWSTLALLPDTLWWLDLLLMPLIAGRLHAFGVILHDAAHMPLRGKTPRVRLLEVLVGYPLATTLDAMRYHHLRHHKDSGMPSDPYYKKGVDSHRRVWLVQWLRGILLLPFWTVRAPFGLLSSVLPSLRPAYARVFLQDKSGATSEELKNSTEVLACARAELGQVLFQAPIIAAFILWPATMAWHFAIPATLTGLLASYRVLCEHRYEPTMDRSIPTLLRTTCDHHLRWWERIFFAPRNIGFHIVHHIHPQVALTHLPALRDWYLTRCGPDYPPPRGRDHV